MSLSAGVLMVKLFQRHRDIQLDGARQLSSPGELVGPQLLQVADEEDEEKLDTAARSSSQLVSSVCTWKTWRP